jgi:hypothetical protein
MLLVPVRDAEAAAEALKGAGLEVVFVGGKKVVNLDNGSKVIIVRDPTISSWS